MCFRPPVEGGDLAFVESKTLDRIYRVFLHMIPAYIIDIIARILGHKPFLVRLVGKMHYGLGLLEYFMTREMPHNVQKENGALMIQRTEIPSVNVRYYAINAFSHLTAYHRFIIAWKVGLSLEHIHFPHSPPSYTLYKH